MAAGWRALLLGLCLAALAACGTPQPRVHFDSQASYDRTFDAARGAMAEQKLVVSVEDRRQGRIVGALDGETITATFEPMLDGTLRVSFLAQNDSPAALVLQQRVAGAYEVRMSKQSILGGFGSSDSYRGPTPCPSAPAFCP